MGFFLEQLRPDYLVDVGFGGLFAIIFGILMAYIVILLLLWVYVSLAFMTIGKKTNHPSPAIAWIPLIGPALISNRAAKMHWWPILLLIGGFIPYVGILFILAFMVFFIIWMWKTFEALGRPGWWALLLLAPFVNYVLLGIAAWGSND